MDFVRSVKTVSLMVMMMKIKIWYFDLMPESQERIDTLVGFREEWLKEPLFTLDFAEVEEPTEEERRIYREEIGPFF